MRVSIETSTEKNFRRVDYTVSTPCFELEKVKNYIAQQEKLGIIQKQRTTPPQKTALLVLMTYAAPNHLR